MDCSVLTEGKVMEQNEHATFQIQNETKIIWKRKRVGRINIAMYQMVIVCFNEMEGRNKGRKKKGNEDIEKNKRKREWMSVCNL